MLLVIAHLRLGGLLPVVVVWEGILCYSSVSLTSFGAACVASAWDETPSLSAWVLTVFLGDRNRFEGIASLSWKDDGSLGEVVGKSQGR